LGIDYTGNSIVVHMAVSGREEFRAGNAFLFGFVREHRSGNNVAYGIDALGAGGEVIVYGNKAFLVQFNAEVFQSELFGIWHTPYRHEHAVAGDGFRAFALDEALAILYPRGCDFALQPE